MKMSVKILVTSVACLGLLAGCSSTQKAPVTSEPKPLTGSAVSFAGTALTKDEAFARAKQVAHVTYGLWFGLEDEHQDFEGRAVVTFELRTKAKDHGRDLFLDFANGTVRSIVLNGNTLLDIATKDRYDGNRIHFKLSELQQTNRIEISFLHPYSHNGHGLHRFKDPVDQAIYLYSDLEPYFAHEIFPCFDQPDLKAAFELTVETPEEWQVVSNTLEREVSKVDGRKSWAFPPTPLLAPYVFALIAGDYASWKGDAEGIPMRLFARKSLKEYVDSKEWFDVTRKGLDFYSVEFGYPYPYSKYDQIVVPEFDSGAMENAAAITFSERMIYRTKVTRDVRERRAETILHEMAHMWFGDLVTMKWWNGLWLNESFATFMSSLASSETLPIAGMKPETAWINFFSNAKTWAYDQDQLVTTHPVDQPVPDTDHAFSNFDGITYGKGASVIKQLRYYLSEDDFREGVQRYFQRYALRNTTLTEFMKMLAEASGKDLASWQDSWLMTAGVNSITADWACDAEGTISKFDLLQKPAENSTILRTHRTEIALYTSKFVPKDVIPMSYSGSSTSVKEAIGKPCPAAVFPNAGDDDYVRVELDPISRKLIAEHLSEVPDLLAREMFWFTLWDMVIDGKLPPTDYSDIVLSQLETEKDPTLTKNVLKRLLSSQLTTNSAVKFMTAEQRAVYLPKIETLSLRKLRAYSTAQKAGGDNQLVWFDAFLESARSMESLEYLKKLLDGKAKIPGLKIDQEVRWDLVQALVRNPGGLSADAAKELIDEQAKQDQTDNGRKLQIAASVQIPDLKSKTAWMDQILVGPTATMTLADLRSEMKFFHVLGQEELSNQFVDRYFSELPKAMQSPDEEYMSYYTGMLFPALCSQRVIDLTTAALKNDLPAQPKKNLRMARQQEERCLKARNQNN